jgi:predicted SnoaL-like aldol condensation-catalyzing enzyme
MLRADGKGKKRGSRVYRMMLQRKTGKSGRNLTSLFLDEYSRHTSELAAGEEAQLAFLHDVLDVRTESYTTRHCTHADVSLLV